MQCQHNKPITPRCPDRVSDRQAERRNAIVAVALRHFMGQGYAGTSVSGICAEVGGSKGTMWSYFPSKEDLFSACVDEATRAFREKMMTILQANLDPSTTVEQFAHGFLVKIFSPDSIALYRLIIGESARQPEIGRIFFARGPAVIRRLLMDYLQDHVTRGTLRANADPAQMAALIISLCQVDLQRMVLCVIERPSDADLMQQSQDIARLFMDVYGA